MKEGEIYISYAHGGESEKTADLIGLTFKAHQIIITRDKNDLNFKGVIKDFMVKIGQAKAVIMIISDKYLKSSFCMFELNEIFGNKDVYERIFPIVMNDADIFTIKGRTSYNDYWFNELKKLDDRIKQQGGGAINVVGNDYHITKSISDNFGRIINSLSDIKTMNEEWYKDPEFNKFIKEVKKRILPAVKTNRKKSPSPQNPIHDPVDREYIISNISKLIDNALRTDIDLQSFCQQHFPSVYNSFGSGQEKVPKIMKLIDYCRQQMEFERLLKLIDSQNPVQFKSNKPYFK